MLGVSRYVYRQWLHAVRACIVARLRRRALEAFRHEARVVFLSSYLRRRIEVTATPGSPVMHRAGAAIACRREETRPAVASPADWAGRTQPIHTSARGARMIGWLRGWAN